jgi:hypothetical protein
MRPVHVLLCTIGSRSALRQRCEYSTVLSQSTALRICDRVDLLCYFVVVYTVVGTWCEMTWILEGRTNDNALT